MSLNQRRSRQFPFTSDMLNSILISDSPFIN